MERERETATIMFTSTELVLRILGETLNGSSYGYVKQALSG